MQKITISLLQGKSQTIRLPSSLCPQVPGLVQVVCGGKRAGAQTELYDDANATGSIFLSADLIQALSVPCPLSCQCRIAQGTVLLGPVIAFLLGRQYIYYGPKNMAEYTDALCRYDTTGGLFYAFSLSGVDYETRTIYGMYYTGNGNWKYGRFPYPSAIFRRGFQVDSPGVEQLHNTVCANIFNSERWDKWHMHCMLEKDPALRCHLPETYDMEHGSEGMCKLLKKHGEIVLKPSDLSRGRGIFIVRRTMQGLQFYNCETRAVESVEDCTAVLDAYLQKNGFTHKHYIMQQKINLATVNQSPFDIRVVLHKDVTAHWRCSGIECRIAGAHRMISNIAQGGRALSIKRTLLLAFGPGADTNAMKESIIQLSTRICESLDQYGVWFEEFGLDIAIDSQKKLWFIEANVRPSFKGFKEMALSNYLYICSRPVQYAIGLTGFEAR